MALPALQKRYHDIRSKLFWRLAEKWGNETLLSTERLYGIFNAVGTIIDNDIEGAFVECGVFKGGGFGFLLDLLDSLGVQDRDVYAYDTFDGFPDDTIDTLYDGKAFKREDWHTHNFRDVFDANIARSDYPKHRIIVCSGSVLETIPETLPDKIAYAYLDTDYYDATLHQLGHIYPRMVPGSTLFVDDYGHFEGCRKATDEYLSGLRPAPFVFRIDYTGRAILPTARS